MTTSTTIASLSDDIDALVACTDVIDAARAAEVQS